jgi:hypothetical protein
MLIDVAAGGPGSGRHKQFGMPVSEEYLKRQAQIGIPPPEGPKYTSSAMANHLYTHGFHHVASYGEVTQDRFDKPGQSVSVDKGDVWDHFGKGGKRTSGTGAKAFHEHMSGLMKIKAGGPGSGPRSGFGAFREAHRTALTYGYKPESSGLTSQGYSHPSGTTLSISRKDGSFESSVKRAGGASSGSAAQLGNHLWSIHSNDHRLAAKGKDKWNKF